MLAKHHEVLAFSGDYVGILGCYSPVLNGQIKISSVLKIRKAQSNLDDTQGKMR